MTRIAIRLLRGLGQIVLMAFAVTLDARASSVDRLPNRAFSPDGKYLITENGSPESEGFEVQIRRKGNDKVLGSCSDGYDSLKVSDDYTEISWSPTSDFVAIKTRTTKRTFETTLFYLHGASAVVVIPNLDYFQNICGRMGTLGEDFRNKNISPSGWKPAKWEGSEVSLKVEVPSLTDDVELAFEVVITCYPPRSDYDSGDPEPRAIVERITGPTQDKKP